jgi:putative acetyltransferase
MPAYRHALQARPVPAAVIIRLEDPAQSDVVELLRHGEAFSASLYPPESNHHLPLHALRRPEVQFLVARDADEKALATGALVLHDGWAEIKRMWVEEAARGRGIAGQILKALMAEAGGASVEMLLLEKGSAITRHWLFTKRLALNGGDPSPTIARTLGASSWKDASDSSQRLTGHWRH